MEKKDWKKTKWKLNAIAVEYNLIERIDKIEEELEGLLDKAREEGKREGILEVLAMFDDYNHPLTFTAEYVREQIIKLLKDK